MTALGTDVLKVHAAYPIYSYAICQFFKKSLMAFAVFEKCINVDKLECAFKILQVIQYSIMKISISEYEGLLRKKFMVSQPLSR